MGAEDRLASAQLNWVDVDWAEAMVLLEHGGTLVTANQRQAQALLLRYAKAQSTTAWPKPAIVAWPQWLEQSFVEYSLKHNTEIRLLDDIQSEWVWQQIIDSDDASDELLNRSACAASAGTAWQLVQDFAVTERELKLYPSAETDAFVRWANQYATQLERLKRIDRSQLARWLCNCLQAKSWQPPSVLLSYGFERWLPVQRELLQAIQAKGGQLHELQLASDAQKLKVVAAADPEQELLHAVQWANEQTKFQSPDDPQQAFKASSTVAIVVPDLHHRRARIESILSSVLQPNLHNLDEQQHQTQHWFDISAAATLADEALVRLAFNWLSLLQGHAGFNVFSSILRSPWFDTDECLSRSRLEVHLRSLGLGQFTLTQIMQLAGLTEAAWYSPGLQSKLRLLLESRQKFNGRQSASEWVTRLSDLLVRLEWPLSEDDDLDALNDAAKQSSQRHNLQQRWTQLLDQFKQLSPRDEHITGKTMIAWLQRLASNIPVQQARPHARVQVLGLLEALGQRFSAVWVTGMTATNWPAAPKPNPLLPVALQRRYQMPQSSPAQELKYAQHATATLQTCAPDVVFSYPQTEQDVNQHPSPLITALADIDKGELIQPQPAWHAMWQQRHLQAFNDQKAPELINLDDEVAAAVGVTHGGSGVLKAQAQCPFQALAAYRLKAEALPQLQPGISALQHGNCVHAVLHTFWKSFKPEQLADEAARNTHLHDCIEQVLSQNTIPCLRQTRLREAYSHYLQTNLEAWLTVEADRPVEFTIQSLEQSKPLQIGPLHLNVRMDRVDQMVDGSRVVLDYKSGRGNPKHWSDERLSEPQLPLYALNMPNIGGVAFANLHPRYAGFMGFTLQPDQLPGVPALGSGRGELHRSYSDWPTLQQMWKQRLETLAGDYFHGHAQADPLPAACQYCRRYSLCRIANINEAADVDNSGGSNG